MSPNPEITSLVDYFEFCGVPGLDQPEDPAGKARSITARQLSLKRKRSEKIHLIDVREPHELAISQIKGAENIPLGELAGQLGKLDSSQEIVLFCKSGSRSQRALEILISAGFRKVKNLRGGINAWAMDVDPKLPVY
jgi:rhodanese-related sulfurtransferase